MATEPTPGTMITANVRLVRPLGAGGMGAVWVADHLALHTQVVVKFIAAELAKNEEAVSRFRREAAAASSVKSPHVVQMLDHGVTDDGVPFIVMELLEGHDLAAHLEAHGRMEPAQVSAIVTQLARALGRAHERGIVHRDIKPHNVFLSDAGGGEVFVKLLDFGIAKTNDAQKLDSGTKTGSMMGSPYYMSPEQVVGSKTVDHRSDLWAVGVVAYEALTGVRPFEAETVGGLAVQIHSAPLPVPSSANGLLPKSIDAWFARACSRDLEARFQSAKELADALALAITGQMPVAMSIPVPSGSGPQIDAMASTAIDPAPSVRSSPDARSRTDAGLGLNTRSSAAPRRPPFMLIGVAVIAVVAIVGVAFAVSSSKSTSDGSGSALADHPTTTATASVTSSATASATAIVPVAPPSTAVAPPSATPRVTTGIPHASAKPSSSSATPKPSATATATHGSSDDDIR